MPTRARANGFGFQQGHRFLGGQSFKPSGSGEAAETAANYGVINDLGEGFGRCAKVYRPGAVSPVLELYWWLRVSAEHFAPFVESCLRPRRRVASESYLTSRGAVWRW